MARCIRLLLAFTLAFTVLSAIASRRLAAQEFRIETDVYIGDEEAAASHTVTLFEKSAVYDFSDSPEQIAVYRGGSDDRPAQFILLDPKSQRRTDIDVSRVEKLMDKLTRWAATQKDPMMQFSAAPSFEEQFDAEGRRLTLSSPQWTYRVATISADDKAALERYREFTDRYAELTAMLYNSPPPGPRQMLNAALAKHGVVPVEIQRTTGGDDKNAVRTAHLFSWRLSREDRARLDEAQAFLASFKKVDNKEFIAVRGQDATIVRGQSR
jgi:hypothetical protein